MKVYHYTSRYDLPSILRSRKFIPGGNPSLPERYLLPKGIQLTGIFALIEPLPKQWVNPNPPFTNVLDVLVEDRGRDLLTEIETEGLNVYVFDFAHMFVPRGMVMYGPDTIPQKYRIPSEVLGPNNENLNSPKTAMRVLDFQRERYLASAVPLEEYMQRRDELNYAMPEVFIMSDRLLSSEGRFEISEQQPLLERKLSKIKDDTRRSWELQELLQAAQGGLDGWYQSYSARQRDNGMPHLSSERVK